MPVRLRAASRGTLKELLLKKVLFGELRLLFSLVNLTRESRLPLSRCRMKPPPPAAYGADECVEGSTYHIIQYKLPHPIVHPYAGAREEASLAQEDPSD
jgi:hypothetical protein